MSNSNPVLEAFDQEALDRIERALGRLCRRRSRGSSIAWSHSAGRIASWSPGGTATGPSPAGAPSRPTSRRGLFSSGRGHLGAP